MSTTQTNGISQSIYFGFIPENQILCQNLLVLEGVKKITDILNKFHTLIKPFQQDTDFKKLFLIQKTSAEATFKFWDFLFSKHDGLNNIVKFLHRNDIPINLKFNSILSIICFKIEDTTEATTTSQILSILFDCFIKYNNQKMLKIKNFIKEILTNDLNPNNEKELKEILSLINTLDAVLKSITTEQIAFKNSKDKIKDMMEKTKDALHLNNLEFLKTELFRKIEEKLEHKLLSRENEEIKRTIKNTLKDIAACDKIKENTFQYSFIFQNVIGIWTVSTKNQKKAGRKIVKPTYFDSPNLYNNFSVPSKENLKIKSNSCVDSILIENKHEIQNEFSDNKIIEKTL